MAGRLRAHPPRHFRPRQCAGAQKRSAILFQLLFSTKQHAIISCERFGLHDVDFALITVTQRLSKFIVLHIFVLCCNRFDSLSIGCFSSYSPSFHHHHPSGKTSTALTPQCCHNDRLPASSGVFSFIYKCNTLIYCRTTQFTYLPFIRSFHPVGCYCQDGYLLYSQYLFALRYVATLNTNLSFQLLEFGD